MREMIVNNGIEELDARAETAAACLCDYCFGPEELDAKAEAVATYCGSGYCCFGSSREMAI